MGSLDRLDVGCERKKEIKNSSKCFCLSSYQVYAKATVVLPNRRMNCHQAQQFLNNEEFSCGGAEREMSIGHRSGNVRPLDVQVWSSERGLDCMYKLWSCQLLINGWNKLGNKIPHNIYWEIMASRSLEQEGKEYQRKFYGCGGTNSDRALKGDQDVSKERGQGAYYRERANGVGMC